MAQVHGGREELDRNQKTVRERKQDVLAFSTEAQLKHAWLRLQQQRLDECTEDEIEEECRRRGLKLNEKPR